MRILEKSSGSARVCPRALRGATLGAGVGLAALLFTGQTASAQTLTYGPILGRGVTPDQTIVRWGTSNPTDATTVAYRKKGTTMWQVLNGSTARDHESILTGLSPGETYEYEVRSLTGPPEAAAFTTCPLPGRPMDFVFYGDSRTGAAQHAKVVMQVGRKAPEMVFESGDIVPAGTYAQYLSEFFPAAKDLIRSTPFMAAPGNHDALSSLPNNYGLVFPSPRASGAPWLSYYSFACGNAKFIALDSNAVSDAPQLTFLTNQLQEARDDSSVDHVFLWFHHPPYSPGSHGDNPTVQTKWVPLFNRPEYKVTAVFGGHDHIYARMNDSSSVFYVVSGGAGANLYSDTGSSKATKTVSKSAFNFVSIHLAGPVMSAVAYDDTGTEIDRFGVTKSGMMADGGGSDAGARDMAGPIDPTGDEDMGGGVDGSSAPGDMAKGPPPSGGCIMVGAGRGSSAGGLGVGSLVLLAGALLLGARRRRYSAA